MAVAMAAGSMSAATPNGRALDCMIVGGHKCGTTSLKEYLAEHPGVVTHPQLEFTGFSEEGYSQSREAEELARLLGTAEGRLTLAKHAGLYADAFGLDRLAEASPRCKVLFILRDPIARTRSAFRMEAVMGTESEEAFEDVIARAVELDRTGEGGADWRVRVYLHWSRYGRWLGEIRRRFPSDNVKVMFQEELTADPRGTYRGLCLWLGLDPEFVPDLNVRHNVGSKPRSAALGRALRLMRSERNPVKRAARGLLPETAYLKLGEAARNANRADRSETRVGNSAVDELLGQYFAEDGEQLRRLLGRELPWDVRDAQPLPHPG